jgi:hypothetical protein
MRLAVGAWEARFRRAQQKARAPLAILGELVTLSSATLNVSAFFSHYFFAFCYHRRRHVSNRRVIRAAKWHFQSHKSSAIWDYASGTFRAFVLPSLSEHDGKEKRKAKRTERQMRSFLFSACSSLLAALMKNTSRQAVSVSVSGKVSGKEHAQ